MRLPKYMPSDAQLFRSPPRGYTYHSLDGEADSPIVGSVDGFDPVKPDYTGIFVVVGLLVLLVWRLKS